MSNKYFNQNECEQISQTIDLLNLLTNLLYDNTLIPHKHTTYFENLSDQHKMGQITDATVDKLNIIFKKYGCELKYHKEGLDVLFETPEIIATID